MNHEGWERAKEVFECALERDSGARAAFLQEACGDDEELRKEVESLLASFQKAEGFIETPALEEALTVIDDRTPAATGRRIGQYEIIREIGCGGRRAGFPRARSAAPRNKTR